MYVEINHRRRIWAFFARFRATTSDSNFNTCSAPRLNSKILNFSNNHFGQLTRKSNFNFFKISDSWFKRLLKTMGLSCPMTNFVIFSASSPPQMIFCNTKLSPKECYNLCTMRVVSCSQMTRMVEMVPAWTNYWASPLWRKRNENRPTKQLWWGQEDLLRNQLQMAKQMILRYDFRDYMFYTGCPRPEFTKRIGYKSC